MEKPKKNKIGVVIVVILVIGAALLYFGSKGGISQSVVPKTRVDNMVGKDILSSLLKLNSLKIDKKIFNDPVYLTLQDFGMSLVQQPVGRPNPFAPIGR